MMELGMNIVSANLSAKNKSALEREFTQRASRISGIVAHQGASGVEVDTDGLVHRGVVLETIILAILSSEAVAEFFKLIKYFLERNNDGEIEIELSDGRKFRVSGANADTKRLAEIIRLTVSEEST